MSEPIVDTSYCDLPDAKLSQITAFLKERWKLGACRTCEGTLYHVLAMVMLRTVKDENTLADSKAHRRPCAAIVCTTCGDVRTLDLTVAGVYARGKKRRRGGSDIETPSGPYR